MAAAIDADAAGIVEGVGLGLDVEDSSGAKAILRGQCAGQQGKTADDAGVEDLSEGADPVGEHDAVDAVLQVGVLVANMQFTACRGILRHAGKLQQHLVELRVAALRQRFNGLVVDLIGIGANRRDDVLADLVEFFILSCQNLRRSLRLRVRRDAMLRRHDRLAGTARFGNARRIHGDFRQLGRGR